MTAICIFGLTEILTLKLVVVRRQTIWDQSARFLRDTFLPVTSPV
jgi:hypothetical protein